MPNLALPFMDTHFSVECIDIILMLIPLHKLLHPLIVDGLLRHRDSVDRWGLKADAIFILNLLLLEKFSNIIFLQHGLLVGCC